MRIRLTHKFHRVAVEIKGLMVLWWSCHVNYLLLSTMIRIQIVLSVHISYRIENHIGEFSFLFFFSIKSLDHLFFLPLHHDRSILYFDSTVRSTMIRLLYSPPLYIRLRLPYLYTFLAVIRLCMSDYNCLVVHSSACSTYNIRIVVNNRSWKYVYTIFQRQ